MNRSMFFVATNRIENSRNTIHCMWLQRIEARAISASLILSMLVGIVTSIYFQRYSISIAVFYGGLDFI